jgi:ribosomal protein S6
MDNNQTNESAEKKSYELSFLVKDEGGAREVSKLLLQHEVVVRGEGQLKKLNLAYEIKHVSQAYFGFVNFAGFPAEVKSLERDLRSNTAVLRALIIKLPKEKTGMAAAAELRRPAKPFVRRRPVGPQLEASKASKPLSNEAIEKKIEEILQ